MNKNQKGFAHLFLLVVVVLIIGGIIYYSWLKWSVKITPNIYMEETSGWQTYINSTRRYSIKYPSFLIRSSFGDDIVVFGKESGPGGPLIITSYPNNEDDAKLYIEYQTRVESETSNSDGKDIKRITVDGQVAYQEKTEISGDVSVATIIKRGDNYYLIMLAQEKDNVLISHDIYDQILSTFKFLD